MFRMLAVTIAVLLCSLDALAGSPLTILFDSQGLKSIKSGGLELLKKGAPGLYRVTWATGEDEPVPGSYVPASTYDPVAMRLTQTWSMGTLTCVYRPQADSLGLSLTFTNTSDRSLGAIEVSALSIVFPDTPTGPGWYQDLHTTSPGIDDAAAVVANYSSGTLVAVSESFTPEPSLAFYSNFDAARVIYDLKFSTLTLGARDFINVDALGLDPGKSITFDISLRSGPAGATLGELAADAFAKYAKQFPRVLNWTDRRPIGSLMLGSLAHRSATNPRGWLNDAAIDVTTAAGKAAFKTKLLAWADRSITECKGCGAQGVIAWDIEGEQFQNIVYVGDPRKLSILAPEMEPLADAFFKKFKDAGLKTGICIRPSRIVTGTTSTWAHQHLSFDPVLEMSDKIATAKRRWGCKLFYIDTNATWAYTGKIDENGQKIVTSWTMRASLMRRLAALHPDVLLIPEFQYTGYYSHTSGYKELRQGFVATPKRVVTTYPGAFSVINLADGDIAGNSTELITAVKRGDILMFRGWWGAPENSYVKAIYSAASK